MGNFLITYKITIVNFKVKMNYRKPNKISVKQLDYLLLYKYFALIIFFKFYHFLLCFVSFYFRCFVKFNNIMKIEWNETKYALCHSKTLKIKNLNEIARSNFYFY